MKMLRVSLWLMLSVAATSFLISCTFVPITPVALDDSDSGPRDSDAPLVNEEETQEDPVLEMLRYVPDLPEYTEYINYSDLLAWYESWALEPAHSGQEFSQKIEPDNQKYLILLRQTRETSVFQHQEHVFSHFRDAYGFDLWNTNRFVETGTLPFPVSIIDSQVGRAQVRNALLDTGYEEESLASGDSLFKIFEDYKPAPRSASLRIRAGALGHLNRIVQNGNTLIVGKATEQVELFASAKDGSRASVADNEAVQALVAALQSPQMDLKNPTINLILSTDPDLQNPNYYIERHENFDRQIAEIFYSNDEILELPPFEIVGFTTHHQNEQTIQTVALVYQNDVDVDAAAQTLSERLDSFISLRLERRAWLGDLSTAVGIEGGGHSVALVSLTIDDPSSFKLENILFPSFGIFMQTNDTFFLTTQPYD